ncbi:mitochondrial amidoxime-reducing component 1 [Polyodon spathula]|uniref:mitochondrial amidoxime-reducing component 1 n=1 Tax=Polyodon spathula TaxID=7913 RepID=UPI001B7DC9A3|nr:mitochondrial amidoxime-reducing component 1 [Polyodon spathula]
MSQLGNLVQICSQNRKGFLCAAGVSLGVIGVGILIKSLVKRRQRKLIQVGVVSELCIYPIKSCKGISVNTAECLEMGLKYGELRDRHWLVIQEDGHKVTGRQEPRLVLLTVSSDDVYLYLNAPEMEELQVPIKLSRSNSVKDCRVWGSDIQGRDCGEEASRWITRYLNNEKTFRLVQYELDMQPRRPHDTEKRFKPNDKVAYPDYSPIMLLSEASLEDLNTRLEKKVEMRHFRPSIIVTGCDAFAEDSWHELQIGGTCLRRVMACGRCIFTTVDPNTGVIDRKQPLETLKSYRKCDPSEQHLYKSAPLFGQCYGVDQTGILHVGDPVYKIIY